MHVDDPFDSDTIRLAELFDTFGLAQTVLGPVPQCAGTLDLVIVPQDIVVVPTVIYHISDHVLVVADLPTRPVLHGSPPRTVRGWRSVDRASFESSRKQSTGSNTVHGCHC